jgi:diguanylate cyclase (GGDEF)-like protein
VVASGRGDALITEDPDRAVRGHRPLPPRVAEALRSLTAVSAALSALGRFEDLLEVAGEEARRAIGAASLSISRLEPDGDTIRTLVNVGAIAPGEQRRPLDEVYLMDDFPEFSKAMRAGVEYVARSDDPDCDPGEHRLLVNLNKSSSISVPILHDGALWGELYATSAMDGQQFSASDVDLLWAVTERVAPAIAAAEQLSRLSTYAYEDALTGLVNRRAFRERLERAVARTRTTGNTVTLVMCDVDGLKAVNDRQGHDAGDRLLIQVADALRDCVHGLPEAVACRTGGDEFCLLVDGRDEQTAKAAIECAVAELAAAEQRVGLSYGVVSTTAGELDAGELLAAADAAQYRAKHARGRVKAARAYRDRDEIPSPLVPLITHVGAMVAVPGRTVDERLTAVCVVAAESLQALAWSLHADDGLGWLQLRGDAERAVPDEQLRRIAAGGEASLGDDGVLYVPATSRGTPYVLRLELGRVPADAVAVRYVVKLALVAALHPA